MSADVGWVGAIAQTHQICCIERWVSLRAKELRFNRPPYQKVKLIIRYYLARMKQRTIRATLILAS